jgi:hypothetical protein
MLAQILFGATALALVLPMAPALAQQANELDVQRRQLQQLQARIDQLEAAQTRTPAAITGGGAAAAANAFNPGIGVVLDGRAGYSRLDPATYAIAGIPLAGEGPGTRGLVLGETELNLTANVDPYFYGVVTVAAEEEAGDTEVELEAAYLETLALPAGWQLRAGKFKSDIGYLNSRHKDGDDFANRPIAYCAFLACGFSDAGLNVSWLAPTTLYLRVGAEAFRGASFPAGGERHNATGARSAFARLGGDIGDSMSWLGGLSMLWANARDRETGDAPDVFEGATGVGMAHFLLKWEGDEKGLKWQSEILRSKMDGTFNGDPVDRTDLGWYSQLIYDWADRWRAGYRYDRISVGNAGAAFAGTTLDDMGHTPSRHSVMVQYNVSEFSRLRLQYDWDNSRAAERNRTIQLQYTMTFGAHPAHPY